MKVLFYLDSFPSYSETFIRDQIVGLIDEGLSIEIFTNVYNKENEKSLVDFNDYELLNLVHLNSVPKTKINKFLSILKIFFKSVFSKNFKYYYATFFLQNFESRRKKINAFFFLDLIIKNKFKIIHAHYGTNGKACTFLKKIEYPIKLICTFHGYDIRLGLKKGKSFYKDLFTHCDTIISISNYNKQKLLELGLKERKIIEVNNGVSVLKDVKNKSNDGIIKFLSVGRLVYDKNFNLALDTLSLYLKNNPNFKFTYDIIGDGNLRESLIDKVNNSNLKGLVTFHLAKNSKYVLSKIKESSLLVLPSINEALPTVILEAFANKTTVLSTNVGSIGDLVINDFTGVIVNPNSNDFYKGLCKIINERDKWEWFALNGFNLINERYNHNKEIKKIIFAYNS